MGYKIAVAISHSLGDCGSSKIYLYVCVFITRCARFTTSRSRYALPYDAALVLPCKGSCYTLDSRWEK